MEDNQPTTAREWLSGKRREEYKFYTQDPTNGADFDTLMKSINERRGLADKYLNDSNCASLSKEILGFNLLPEK